MTVPLFGGMPGAPELLVIFLLLFVLLIPLGLAVWVYVDAADRTDHPVAWAAAVAVAGVSPFFVGSIAVTVLYLLVREELGAAAPPTVAETGLDEDATVLGEPVGEREGPMEASTESADSEASTESAEDDRDEPERS